MEETKEYTHLEMLYASHVIAGFRTIEQVPSLIRDRVAEIVALSASK